MSFLLDLFFSLPWETLEHALLDLLESRSQNLVPCHPPMASADGETNTTMKMKMKMKTRMTTGTGTGTGGKRSREQDGDAKTPSKSFPVFRKFVARIVAATKTLPVTILSSLVYLERLSARLSPKAYGHKETAYRVFVASIIIGTKFLQDGAMRNDSWASYLSPWFSPQELNSMERQFLQCVNYDLAISPTHLEQVILSDQRLLDIVCPLVFSCNSGYFGSGLQRTFPTPTPTPILIPIPTPRAHTCRAPPAASAAEPQYYDFFASVGTPSLDHGPGAKYLVQASPPPPPPSPESLADCLGGSKSVLDLALPLPLSHLHAKTALGHMLPEVLWGAPPALLAPFV